MKIIVFLDFCALGSVNEWIDGEGLVDVEFRRLNIACPEQGVAAITSLGEHMTEGKL